MLILPAIDLKDGQVVRYTKGRLHKKVYSDDPLSIALSWQAQGAEFLHLVDLDGAMTGVQKNLSIIKKITKTLKIPVEVGGGIRDLTAVKKVIGSGAERIILGTKAIEDFGFLEKALERYGDAIALSIDAAGKKVGLYGWSSASSLGLDCLFKKLQKIRLKTIIYTDITRDGTLQGVNLSRVKSILRSTAINVIISGGVSSLTDIQKLAKLTFSHFKGVIVGKALYEHKFSLQEALAVVREEG